VSDRKARADHFSKLSAAYAAFRPRYPDALVDFLSSIAPGNHCVWDVGAGSGQATGALAERFEHVIATDISSEQISRAPTNPKVEWHVAPAETVPMIADASVDLVTVAQALHWFDHPRFYAEVQRVSVPHGVIAAWSYAPARMDGQVGEVLHRYMYGDVGAYWPPERKYVDNEYRDIPFPFERIAVPPMSLENDWTLEQVAGYLRSMSATGRYVEQQGTDPVVRVEAELRGLWGASPTRRITWPLILLAGRANVVATVNGG
jgi:SAM-dependent methyltransferase